MRFTLKIDRTGAVSLAFSYLAPGASAAQDFSVVEVDQIPRLTPPTDVVAAYSRRIVQVHPYGPHRVPWFHLVKLPHGG